MRHTKQLAGVRDVVGTVAIGEQAIMANAMETVGQHMDEETPDELVDVECHEFILDGALGPIVLPFESDAFAIEGDKPAVGNGNPMGIAGQVSEHRLWSAERPFGIDHPFYAPQRREVSREGLRLGQAGMVAEEVQMSGVVGSGQLVEEQAAEEARQYPDRQEEAGPAGYPLLAVRRDAAAWNDDVGMGMMTPTSTIP